tara:strand:- start:8442 stop:9326 length:885 start_codon:yes stop_codon:yes gene_type:complete
MNRTTRPVTVHFFDIEAKQNFFEKFSANFEFNNSNSLNTRILSIRSKKHLFKTLESSSTDLGKSYAITVVRERNTWQTKATRDGKITGISSNQGIIGDPYYFLIIPSKKTILGFTTGPSGSLKAVAKTMLEQFKTDRSDEITLNFIPKEKEFITLNEIPEYKSLHFKINSSSLSDISEDAPPLIKDLSAAPYIENNVQLSLDLEFNELTEHDFSKENIIEIVTFLSDHEGCSLLTVKGINGDGNSIKLDFGNAFYNYKTDVVTRQDFIDEKSSLNILHSALLSYQKTPIPRQTV